MLAAAAHQVLTKEPQCAKVEHDKGSLNTPRGEEAVGITLLYTGSGDGMAREKGWLRFH